MNQFCVLPTKVLANFLADKCFLFYGTIIMFELRGHVCVVLHREESVTITILFITKTRKAF